MQTKSPNRDNDGISPTAPSLKKRKKAGKNNEKDFKDDVTGDDLDVPGSEFEGEERNGNEDEENDYYSLGGDDHNDLDKDRGE